MAAAVTQGQIRVSCTGATNNLDRRGKVDKEILQEYMDACALIKETEQRIKRLDQKRKTMVQTNVKGSNPEFPYQAQHFRIQGTTFTVKDDSSIRYEAAVLEKERENAERIKKKVEEWMASIPIRMQRIVRYKYLEEMTWEQVAARMGRKSTADSVRKEFERFFQKN